MILGIDYDPERIKSAEEIAEDIGVAHLLDFRVADALEVRFPFRLQLIAIQDFEWVTKATKVYMYLAPGFLRQAPLRTAVASYLKRSPNNRLVCYDYPLPDGTPVNVDTVHRLYVYQGAAPEPAAVSVPAPPTVSDATSSTSAPAATGSAA